MSPDIAAVIFAIGICALFVLDRDRQARTSKALWLPVVWLVIAGSRELSQWLATFGIGDRASLFTASHLLDGDPTDRVLYTGLLLLGIIVLTSRRHLMGEPMKKNWPILLFFLYCAVSVFWSDYPEVAFKRWIKAVGDVVMIMIVVTDPNPSSAIKRFLARPAFLLIPLSVLFIKYYPELGKGYKAFVFTPVYFGVTTHKNILGMICLLFGLASEWRLLAILRDRKGKHRTRHLIAHGALLGMALWLFSMASSMTSFACFVLTGGLMAATGLGRFARKPVVVHFLVATVLGVSFATLFLGIGQDALGAMGKDATLTGRTAIWELVLSLSGNPLVGSGFESFWLGWRLDRIWSVYWWHPNEAHNGYLEVFLNLGWTGLGLLALVIMTGYRNIIVAFRSDPEFSTLRLAYFVVELVYNFTEAGFRMMDPVWIMFLLAVMAVPPPRPAATHANINESSSPEVLNSAGREHSSKLVGTYQATYFQH